MRKTVGLYAFGFLLLTASTSSAQLHSISADEWVLPNGTVSIPVYVNNSVIVSWTNRGSRNEANVILTAYITDPSNVVVYRDTQVVASWLSGDPYQTTFRDFSPSKIGTHKFCAAALLPTDQQKGDDTLCINVTTNYLNDGMALNILVPAEGELRPQKIAFNPKARFKGLGLMPIEEPTFRMEIRRCTDNQVVFRSDTIIDVLLVDSTVTVTFPSKQRGYDIRSLTPGCYNAEARIISNADANYLNDAATSEFTVTLNSLPIDVRPDSILAPLPGSTIPKIDSFIPAVNIRNTGMNTQSNFKVIFILSNPIGTEMYRDTAVIATIASNEVKTLSFKQYSMPASLNRSGLYRLTAITLLAGDQYELDDTLRKTVMFGHKRDVAFIASDIIPRGVFVNIGSTVHNKYNVKVNWSDTSLLGIGTLFTQTRVFDDSLIVSTFNAENVMPFMSPQFGRQSTLPTSKAGGYQVKIINVTSDDGDQTNDTLTYLYYVIRTDLQVNIMADMLHQPVRYSQYAPSDSITIRGRFYNNGVNELQNVPIVCRFRNGSDTVFSEPIIVDHLWKSGTYIDTTFTVAPVNKKGYFTLDVYSLAEGEMNHTDDTLHQTVVIAYAHDVFPVEILKPTANEEIKQRTLFKPKASYRWEGGKDTVDVRVRFEIRGCTNNMVYYRADTIIQKFVYSDNDKVIEFPAVNGAFRTDSLQPGCYVAEAITRHTMDSRTMNDTIRQMFTITSEQSVDMPMLRTVMMYPNPFTSNVTLTFSAEQIGTVWIRFIDRLGNEVNDLSQTHQFGSGNNEITITTESLSSGTYFAEIVFSGASGSGRTIIPIQCIR